jgi:hypothetical protein
MGATVLSVAIERKAWSLAALCLLLGVADAAAALPPETIENLLELLEAPARGRRR